MDAAKLNKGIGFPLWVWILLAFLVWLLNWLTVFVCFPLDPNDPSVAWAMRGQFGDLFGGFTALSTALAFAGLLYTIQLQRKELHAQTEARRHEAQLSALAAQIQVLIQIQAIDDNDRRNDTWRKIAIAPGGPGEGARIEDAIATQIIYLDKLANGPLDRLGVQRT